MLSVRLSPNHSQCLLPTLFLMRIPAISLRPASLPALPVSQQTVKRVSAFDNVVYSRSLTSCRLPVRWQNICTHWTGYLFRLPSDKSCIPRWRRCNRHYSTPDVLLHRRSRSHTSRIYSWFECSSSLGCSSLPSLTPSGYERCATLFGQRCSPADGRFTRASLCGTPT